MSHYRTIKTSLSQGPALVRALTQLGANPAWSLDFQDNSLAIKNGWDTKQAAIRVEGSTLLSGGLIPSRLFGNGSIGYRWDAAAGSYELVQDTASDSAKLAGFNQRVAQRYGVEVAFEAAVAAGWSPFEEQQADGSVVITCTRY